MRRRGRAPTIPGRSTVPPARCARVPTRGSPGGTLEERLDVVLVGEELQRVRLLVGRQSAQRLLGPRPVPALHCVPRGRRTRELIRAGHRRRRRDRQSRGSRSSSRAVGCCAVGARHANSAEPDWNRGCARCRRPPGWVPMRQSPRLWITPSQSPLELRRDLEAEGRRECRRPSVNSVDRSAELMVRLTAAMTTGEPRRPQSDPDRTETQGSPA